MNRYYRIGMVVSLLFVISACTTTESVTSDAQRQDAETLGTYDTRGSITGTAVPGQPGVSDTYGYNPGGAYVGGPTATQAQRVIYFEFDSAQVTAESQNIIAAHVNYLRNNPNVAVVLEGHADERGTREYNIGLGDRRNSTVRQLMIASGVAPQQIQTVSYGEERPATLGQDENSYALNRRVEIIY